MTKMIGVVAAAALLLLAGCTSEPEGPTAEEVRQSHCDAFAAITPGVLELQESIEVLSDPGSDQPDRARAIRVAMDEQSGNGRKHAYDCDLKSDQELFARFVADAEANQSEK